jgi:serine dehydrogenase proteinase
MALPERIELYKAIEAERKRPLIVYVTSMRRNAEAQIARDAICELLAQLQALPAGTKNLDLLIGSNGGDATVAWRIVSLIRECVDSFSVLVPQAAFSAATLIALGADEIVMHPHANLGPTDPQITNRAKNVQFGSEDLTAFLKFARDEVGLTDQLPMLELFKHFSVEVGFVGIGVAARSAQLARSMSEKLLRLHMKTEGQMQKAKIISEALNTKYFHHGYPLSRSEAKEIGLPVAAGNPPIEELMRKVWLDIEQELKFREPFSPVNILKNDPACAALFSPVVPGAAQLGVPPARMHQIASLMESERHATRFILEGDILAMRLPDLNLKISVVQHKEGWVDMSVPAKKTSKKIKKAL